MLIQMNDGARFSGRNAKAIVRKMRDSAWMFESPKRDYMAGVAEHIRDAEHVTIETHTAEAFVVSLVDHQLAVVIHGERSLRKSV